MVGFPDVPAGWAGKIGLGGALPARDTSGENIWMVRSMISYFGIRCWIAIIDFLSWVDLIAFVFRDLVVLARCLNLLMLQKVRKTPFACTDLVVHLHNSYCCVGFLASKPQKARLLA